MKCGNEAAGVVTANLQTWSIYLHKQIANPTAFVLPHNMVQYDFHGIKFRNQIANPVRAASMSTRHRPHASVFFVQLSLVFLTIAIPFDTSPVEVVEAPPPRIEFAATCCFVARGSP